MTRYTILMAGTRVHGAGTPRALRRGNQRACTRRTQCVAGFRSPKTGVYKHLWDRRPDPTLTLASEPTLPPPPLSSNVASGLPPPHAVVRTQCEATCGGGQRASKRGQSRESNTVRLDTR